MIRARSVLLEPSTKAPAVAVTEKLVASLVRVLTVEPPPTKKVANSIVPLVAVFHALMGQKEAPPVTFATNVSATDSTYALVVP